MSIEEQARVANLPFWMQSQRAAEEKEIDVMDGDGGGDDQGGDEDSEGGEETPRVEKKTETPMPPPMLAASAPMAPRMTPPMVDLPRLLRRRRPSGRIGTRRCLAQNTRISPP
jgi:hypothetical protein